MVIINKSKCNRFLNLFLLALTEIANFDNFNEISSLLLLRNTRMILVAFNTHLSWTKGPIIKYVYWGVVGVVEGKLGGGGYETNYLTLGGGVRDELRHSWGGGGAKQKMSGILCLWLIRQQTL